MDIKLRRDCWFCKYSGGSPPGLAARSDRETGESRKNIERIWDGKHNLQVGASKKWYGNR